MALTIPEDGMLVHSQAVVPRRHGNWCHLLHQVKEESLSFPFRR